VVRVGIVAAIVDVVRGGGVERGGVVDVVDCCCITVGLVGLLSVNESVCRTILLVAVDLSVYLSITRLFNSAVTAHFQFM